MKIIVTNKDIEQGRRSDPHACPVARALLRAGVDHFGVMGPSVMLTDESDYLVSSLLPSRVRQWISDFDNGKAVFPLTFDLGVRGAREHSFSDTPDQNELRSPTSTLFPPFNRTDSESPSEERVEQTEALVSAR